VQAVRRVWLGFPFFVGGLPVGALPVGALPIVILLNVIGATILLPLTALYPPLTDWLATRKARESRESDRPSLYLPATPIVKYVVASACECTLALLLTLPSTAWLADPLHGYLLLAWVTSSLAWEIRQMVVTAGTTVWTRASAYLTDRFNRIDLPAILFSLAALVSAIVLDGGSPECGKPADNPLSLDLEGCPPPSYETSTLRASAALFLWLRVLRILLVVPWLGPYILMVFRMVQDVLKFLAILFVAVLSFTAAFFNLYEPAPAVRSTPTNGWPSLGSEPTCIAYMDAFSSALVFLLQASVTGDNLFECVRDSTHPIGGWALAFLYYAFLGLLMLNMLIAMMAKTFDNVWEAAVPNFRYLFTQMVHSLKEQPPAPPPLYLLTLPYECVQIIKWCRDQQKGVSKDTADNEMTAKIELEKSEDELVRELTEYIQDNQDDVAQEERWRTILKKDMSAKFAKQQEQLMDVKKQQMDLVAMLGTLLEHHGLQMPQAALAPSMAASVMLEGTSSVEAPAAEPPAAEPPNSAGSGMATNVGPSSQTLSDEAATADDDGSNI